MRRVFWVALGATAGVVAIRRLGRLAQSYSPEGLSRTAAGLAETVRETRRTVRAGMAEREEELRYALGIDAGTVPVPDPADRDPDPADRDPDPGAMI